MISDNARLNSFREVLQQHGLDGFVVPLSDEHLSEYVGGYAQRLAWLTGFTGSAGTAVVLDERAALFVDGRYTLQVRGQVDNAAWTFESPRSTPIAHWLALNARAGTRLGFDPWLHTQPWRDEIELVLAQNGSALVAVKSNLVDLIWEDKPPRPGNSLVPHALKFAGTTSQKKREHIGAWLEGHGADVAILTSLDAVAWTFNIRGNDIEHTPVALAYAIVRRNGSADLFVDPAKVTASVREHLGEDVHLHDYDDFEGRLRGLRGQRVAIDPAKTVCAIIDILTTAGASLIRAEDPTLVPKAVKSPAEIRGHRAAQRRDCTALCRFLHWLSVHALNGEISELSASRQLRRFREANPELRDLSFEAISGFGPNSAIIHYHPSAETDRLLEPGSLYLVDSGGQYVDGTTDITRTVAIGTPTAEMRDRYTRVLKGHIALARARFPNDTCGVQLDILARQHLWDVGCDFAHGSGHGVGSYLSVHEGPQIIHRRVTADAPFRAGMILSNEPGYYKAGAFGIRIENLMLVTPLEIR